VVPEAYTLGLLERSPMSNWTNPQRDTTYYHY